MNTRFTFVFTLLLLVVGSRGAQAQTPPNFFSNVVVFNDTQQVIAIQTGWHGEGWNDTIHVAPGQNRSFPYPYKYPNENRAPWFLLGVYNAANNHKVNYHIYATPAPTKPQNPNQFTAVRIKASGNNMYADGDPARINRGHWESYKLHGVELGGWNRFVD